MTSQGLRDAHRLDTLAPLPPSFYNRDPRRVARELLGKVLVRREGHGLRAGRIVELEAYLGRKDPAAHAFSGPTSRNLVLFGPPGRAYVYFIYGNHYCLNVSCEPEGKAGCLLFRALEPVAGVERMAAARDLKISPGARPSELRLIAGGPGRLAEALDITRERDNGKDFSSGDSDLVIVDDGYGRARIATTPRVGITKAAQNRLRYVIVDNEFVSGKRVRSTRRHGDTEEMKNR
ncbi:MAG TPA: DNA-3-methyladenine glycosylase [Terriglobales bacterium]|nr:DNA-3-methyladenine glycosylase [Terriglobales bacterium]